MVRRVLTLHGLILVGLLALMGPLTPTYAEAVNDSLDVAKTSQKTICEQTDSLARQACQDSLALLNPQPSKHGATLAESEDPRSQKNEEAKPRIERDAVATDADEDSRNMVYVGQFMSDMGESGSGSDLAAVIFVGVGIVVIGGVIVYLPKLIYDMVRNKQRYRVDHELGFTYTYSVANWEGGGSPLYRRTLMPGLRYSAVIARPYVGVGLTLEGGYLASELSGSLAIPERVKDDGVYALAGPVLRLAPNSPTQFTFEFLNGTSSAENVGWVSKARISLSQRFNEHFVMALQLGSLFYDLHFFDGLIYREGNLNRDLTLTYGLEMAWRF